jgi:hypothetical protein
MDSQIDGLKAQALLGALVSGVWMATTTLTASRCEENRCLRNAIHRRMRPKVNHVFYIEAAGDKETAASFP